MGPRARARLIAAATCAAAVLGAPAGCGESEADRVEETVERHIHGFYEADFAQACDALSTRAQQTAVETLSAELPELRIRSCEDAYRTFLNIGSFAEGLSGIMDLDAIRSEDLPDLDVHDIDVDGSRASARVATSERRVELERIDDEWKIARLDFSDAK
jgi:hypothetical protein